MLSPDLFPGKTIPLPSARFALRRWTALSATGTDAAAFLQAQTMNDVRSLVPGNWHWNGWLSAKGRLIALFALLRRRDDAFTLIVPDMPATELAAALQRFVFRSKVRLHAQPDGGVFGQYDPPPCAARGDVALEHPGETWTLDLGAPGHCRSLHVLAGDAPAASPPAADPVTQAEADDLNARWLADDLRLGLPRLSEAQRGAWTPQMLSLQRLRAFSLAKGCYPGQEIVARTHYLGQAKRSLHLLAGTDMAESAAVRDADGGVLGAVLCTDPAGSLALAVLTGEAGSGPVWVADRQAREEPLHDGLQRPV